MINEITIEVQWTLARRVYAAALDIEPWQVDDTDGSYGDVAELLAKDDWERSKIVARALGLPDDTEWGEILAQIERLRAIVQTLETGSPGRLSCRNCGWPREVHHPSFSPKDPAHHCTGFEPRGEPS